VTGCLVEQIFCDLVPLRVVPTLIFAGIIYPMMSLRGPEIGYFVKFVVLVVLLVMTSTAVNLVLGMLTKNIMSGILIGTIVTIHFFMLTDLFVNFKSLSVWLRWLNQASFINYAYEGLAQNELVNRHLENFPGVRVAEDEARVCCSSC
jgi:ABC-type multidrug transport system permease subunit